MRQKSETRGTSEQVVKDIRRAGRDKRGDVLNIALLQQQRDA